MDDRPLLLFLLMTVYILGGYVSFEMTCAVSKKRFGLWSYILMMLAWAPAAFLALMFRTIFIGEHKNDKG